VKLLLNKTSELNGELEKNQPKRFSLPYMEAKQKNYKEEKNLRKPYEAILFSLMLVSFYRFFFSKDLGKIL